MKAINIIIFLVASLMSQIVSANSDAYKEAEKLLETMGMEQAMSQSIAQMLDLQMQQNPALAPYKAVMLKFFEKHMSWESMKPDMTKIYANAFSADELKDINAFYSTATGKKTIKLMPTLMAQGGQLGATRVQQNLGELDAMIKAESERLQKLSNP